MRELLREGAGIVWISGSEDPQVMADVPPARASRRVIDRPACRPTAARSARRCALARRRPGRRPRGPPRSTPSSTPIRPSRARQRPAALRPARRRRSAGRLAPARGAACASAGRLTALDLRELRLRAPGTDLQSGAAGGHDLARWDQRRARPPHHAEHPHRGGVHQPGAGRRPPGRSAARGRWPLAGRVIEGSPASSGAGASCASRPPTRPTASSWRPTSRATAEPARLGELALVDNSSRVGAAGRPFFTTLLDENAAAHIAFGARLRRLPRARRSAGEPLGRAPRRHDRLARDGRRGGRRATAGR